MAYVLAVLSKDQDSVPRSIVGISHTTDNNVIQLKNIEYSAKGKDKWEPTLEASSPSFKEAFPRGVFCERIVTASAVCVCQGHSLETWRPGDHRLLLSGYPHSRYPRGQFVFDVTCIIYRENLYPLSILLVLMECQQRFKNQGAQTAAEDQPCETGFLMRVVIGLMCQPFHTTLILTTKI